MTEGAADRAAPRHLPRALLLLGILLPLALLWRGLDASSLWIDELFTAYFVDPAQAPGDLLRRAGEDVHPPLFYLLLHLYLKLWPPLDPQALPPVMRSFSLLAGMVTLALCVLAFRPVLRLEGRLAFAAIAALATPFLLQALEARSYALAWVWSTALLAFAMRTLAELRAGRDGAGPLSGVVLSGLAGAFTHYYALLLAGGTLGWLLLRGRNWEQRCHVVLAGLAILGPAGLYAAWQFGQVVAADGDANWMQPTSGFLRDQFAWLPEKLFSSWLGLLPALAAAGLLATAPRGPKAAVSSADLLALALLPMLFMLLAGLAITLAVVPSFTSRNLIVGLPFVWFAIALAFDRGTAGRAPAWRAACTVLFAALVLANAVRLGAVAQPLRDEWRGSAAAVAAQPACFHAVLPVVDFPGPQIAIATASAFYGWYLPERPASRFLGVPQRAGVVAPPSGDWAALLAARAQGLDPCPVLLWSVHHLGWAEARAAAEAIVRHYSQTGQEDAAARVRMRQFTSFGFSFDGGVHRAERAFLIVLAPPPPK